MTIEKAISRLIEFYNKAKKEGKKYPVAWAVHKTDEWLHHMVKSHGEDVEGNAINTLFEDEATVKRIPHSHESNTQWT